MGKISEEGNAKSSKPRCCRAVYPYNPQQSDELHLSVGDKITDVEDVGNGWVIGHNKTTGMTGLCPRMYLQERVRVKKRLNSTKNRISSIYLNMNRPTASSAGTDIFAITKGGKNSFRSNMSQIDLIDDDNDDDHAETRTSSFIKTVIGLLGGILLGTLLFTALHYLYHFTLLEAEATSGAITLIMCLGLLISRHVRCLVALMSVTIFTGQGRVAILSLVPGLLISGPIMNMQRNMNEGANSVGCIAEIVFNQTLAVHHQLLTSVTKQQENLQNSSNQYKLVIRNVTSKLNKKNVTECLQRLKQMEDECEADVRRVKLSCEAAGSSPVGKHALRLITNTALPHVKCATLCETLDPRRLCSHLNRGLCTSSRRPARSITARFIPLKQQLQELLGFHVNSSRVIDVTANNSFNPVQKIQEVKEDLQKRLDFTVHVIRIMNKILILFLLLAFINAGLYLRNYLKSIKHDNIYLTTQFKRLNTQLSKTDELKVVLPLQKKEKKKYVDSTSLKLCQAEAFAWKVGMSQVLFHIIIAFIFIFLDYALFYLLQFIKNNGGVDILISGGAFLEVDIDGIGPVADFVRNLFNGLNTSNSFQNVLNFESCLPNASEPSKKIMILISALYIITLLFVMMQAYGLRVRHKMMGFFFPERESERIHYLYRHILLKRNVREYEEKKINLLTDSWAI